MFFKSTFKKIMKTNSQSIHYLTIKLKKNQSKNNTIKLPKST
jgi:hypothetical protein